MSDDILFGKAAQYQPFYVNSTGVYLKNEKGHDVFVCGPLRILAMTRDENHQNFGKLLQWSDADGHVHEWSMPSEYLAASDGRDILKKLLNEGFQDIKNKKLLREYLSDQPIEARAICVTKTGWHDLAFVLPDMVIGQEGGERLVLHDGGTGNNIYQEKGTLKDWQENVSFFCVDNSRLAFVVSAAFAALLMKWAGIDGCGFNLKGNSSLGKTVAAKVATSVCGGRNYMVAWRATTNGLEGRAVLRNDTIMVMDEMGQVDPNYIGEVAYMLANGIGKTRSDQKGMAKEARTWRTLVLSTGETGLSDHLASTGKKVKAGQEVRLVDIPMDTGSGYGGFECLHEFKSAQLLAEHLERMSEQFYGVALRPFIENIQGKEEVITKMILKMRRDFIEEHVPDDAEGQVTRVASFFALVSAGGEAATQAGITGWEPGEATKAATTCFLGWLKDRDGAGNSEDKNIMATVRSFIQLHGQSRFAQWEINSGFSERVNERVGYICKENNETRYYIFRDTFRDIVCKNIPYKRALELLKQKDLLISDKGRDIAARRPPAESITVQFYCIRGKVLDG